MTREAPLHILLASTNPAKIDRLRDCLDGWPFAFRRVEELPGHEPPEETGGTHREIAESKALEWARIGGCLAIASDGGIDIPALGPDWDSVLTRRAAGEGATDEDRITHLLALMDNLHVDGEREATWREAVTLANPDGLIHSWEVCGPTGIIRREPSAARIDGFWLASLWFFPEIGKAYTELSPQELDLIGDPWLRLKAGIQTWLRDGGYEALS